MKRDLRINYANLKYIQRQLIQYVEEIRALSAAANVFLAVMQAQDSDAYKKLRKHWNDKVIDNASMLSGRLEQVAENLGGYISATQGARISQSKEKRTPLYQVFSIRKQGRQQRGTLKREPTPGSQVQP